MAFKAIYVNDIGLIITPRTYLRPYY